LNSINLSAKSDVNELLIGFSSVKNEWHGSIWVVLTFTLSSSRFVVNNFIWIKLSFRELVVHKDLIVLIFELVFKDLAVHLIDLLVDASL
jgi:hypothetical protein